MILLGIYLEILSGKPSEILWFIQVCFQDSSRDSFLGFSSPGMHCRILLRNYTRILSKTPLENLPKISPVIPGANRLISCLWNTLDREDHKLGWVSSNVRCLKDLEYSEDWSICCVMEFRIDNQPLLLGKHSELVLFSKLSTHYC